MKALLLAAGLGTRLRPLTDRVPKCLVPIRGRPLLDHWLHRLTQAGLGPLLVNAHHHPDQVEAFLKASPYAGNVTLAFEPELLGTGGTLLAHKAFFSDGPFLVAHADNLSAFDVQAFVSRHAARPQGCELTVMTFRTDRPSTCGILGLDARGVITTWDEKPERPSGNLANGAVYIFEPSVFRHLETLGGPCIDLSTQVLPAFLGRMASFENRWYHRDIGTPESYAQAQRDDRYLAEAEP